MKSSLPLSFSITNTARKLNSYTLANLPVGFFDARVHHLNEHFVELLKLDHQFLLLLHFAEAVFGEHPCVVEKQVALTGQLNPEVFNLVRSVTAL